MNEPTQLPPPPALGERCYRHPEVETGVHCTRCGRPICTDCMIPAPVGHRCPDCVREARQEFRRPTVGPTPRRFTLTNAVVVVLVGIYVLSVLAGGGLANLFQGPSTLTVVRLGAAVGFGIIPGEGEVGIAVGEQWRLFTAMFLHAGLLHLLFNAYALSIFGNAVEQELGGRRFLTIYLATGLFASAASYAFGEPTAVSVGASGALYGLFGVFLAYNWRRRALAFHAARARSAITLIAINLLFTFAVPNIDWRAHVGGLVAGLVIGVAADGWGTPASRRTGFVLATLVSLGATAALTITRTNEIRGLLSL